MENKEKFRCHFSKVFEEIFFAIFLIIIDVGRNLTNLIDNISFEDLINNINNVKGNLIIIIILLLIVFYRINIWRKTWIYIDDKALVIEKDTLNKKVNTIALSNISNVNLEQNLLERVLGTCKLKLDTNSKSTADETDVKIILKKDKALELKNKILHLSITKQTEEIEEKYDIKYSLKDVILNGFYSASVGSIIYVVTLIILGVILHNEIIENIKNANIKSILIYSIFFIGNAIYFLFKDILKYYNFKVGRRGDKIYLSYGLADKKDYSIPVDKINGIIIDSPVISRIANKKSLDIINIGIGDEKSEGAKLLLSGTDTEIRQKLKKILPEFNIPMDYEVKRQNKKVLVLSIIYFAIFSLIVIPCSIKFSLIFLILIPIYILVSLMKYFTLGLYYGEDGILIYRGIFRRIGKYFLYEKVQNIIIKSNVIAEKLKIRKMDVFILASIINSTASIGYYDNEIIENINKRIR